MYSFTNDYAEGAHPRILKALSETNWEQTAGYGQDPYSLEAVSLLKKRIGRPDVDIHFVPGGTQANLITISAFLRPHEAVLAPASGHVLVHEAGAIEATGHKIISLEAEDGKLRPKEMAKALKAHTDEHMVKPRLAYISNSTEVGSIYTKAELRELSSFCKEHNLLLYLDGARLGAALTAKGNDLTLNEIAGLVDAFYIGGTKNGALIGEAIVICNKALQADFRFLIKQKGALLAKGRLLGIQFRELFRDDLFFELARHANRLAAKMQDALRQAGFPFLLSSPSNQIFPILPNRLLADLRKKYSFYVWEEVDEQYSALRLVTSWATPEAAVDEFLAYLETLS